LEDLVLTVGDSFPAYELTACVSTDPLKPFATIDSESGAGRWRVVFFWPKDFTFVCPTELAAFGDVHDQFVRRQADVLGVSVDSEYVHLAWRKGHPHLRDLPYPMLSDIKREFAEACGVLGPDGVAQRATFIVDPDNVIEFAMVTADSVGRNVSEVLRCLHALQTDELTPCNWRPGQKTLDADELLAAG
jgi:lipoyl-dependent peroxiredoxin subunit C